MVKLTYKDGDVKTYNPSLPVETQLRNVSLVKICWEKDCRDVNFFLTDLSRAMEFKMIEPFEFEVDHGNSIAGARAKKQTKIIKDRMTFAWLVKEVVNFQNHIDKSLENLSTHIRTNLVK